MLKATDDLENKVLKIKRLPYGKVKLKIGKFSFSRMSCRKAV